MDTPQPENKMPATVTNLFTKDEINHKFIIQNGIVIPCQNVLHWAEWMEANRRNHHAQQVARGIRVSTIFLGVNYNFSTFGKPILWETMIFVKSRNSHKRLDRMMWRYMSKEHADQMHATICKIINSGYSVGWIRKRLEEL